MTATSPLNLTGQLYALSTIPPDAYVHCNENGDIVPTWGYLVRAQGLANVYHGHTPGKTAEDINTFVQDLIQKISDEVSKTLTTDDPSLTKRTFHKHLFLNQQVQEAIRGKKDGGGLQGLCTTYTDEAREKIKDSIKTMGNQALEALKRLKEKISEYAHFTEEDLSSMVHYKYDSLTLPFCPEEHYTDEEWEEAIELSTSLKTGYIDYYNYYGKYSCGLLFKQVLSGLNVRNWWDEIGHFENGKLLLGGLPLNVLGKSDLTALKEEKVEAILSMTEVFENTSIGYFTTPITPKDCKQSQIKQLQIPTPDRETIYLEYLSRGVEFIHWNLKNGRNILVHCKAGEKRSALTAMCYLIKYQNKTAEEAYKIVCENRNVAGFSEDRNERQTLQTYGQLHQN